MAGITDAERMRRRMAPKEFLDSIDAQAQWKRYLNSADDRVSLDCWKYLHDRVLGKPAQAMDLTTKGDALTQVIVNL